MYLESIFSAPDIQKQLPKETVQFLRVDQVWPSPLIDAKSLPGVRVKIRTFTSRGMLYSANCIFHWELREFFFMQNFKETMRKTRKKPNVVECCSSEKILSMFQVSYWGESIRYSSVFYCCVRKQTKPLKRFRKALKIISKPSEWAFQGLKHFESHGIILECTAYPVWYFFLSGSTFFPMTSCLKSFLKLEIHVPCRSNFNRYTRLARVYWSKFINFPLLAFIPRNIFMRDINSFQLIHLSWTMHSRISGNVLMQWPQPILKMDRRWRENTYQPLSLQPWIVQKRKRLLSEALSVVNYAH